MKKRLISIIALCIATSACATIDTPSTNKPHASDLPNYSAYIAAAIADWVIEEAQDKQFNYVKLLTSEPDVARSEIEKRLQLNSIIVTNDESLPSLKVAYSVYEIDDKILIRIKTDDFEATRLFNKSEGNSIIPVSPLTIRANP